MSRKFFAADPNEIRTRSKQAFREAAKCHGVANCNRQPASSL
jgi:hypothetical protein